MTSRTAEKGPVRLHWLQRIFADRWWLMVLALSMQVWWIDQTLLRYGTIQRLPWILLLGVIVSGFVPEIRRLGSCRGNSAVSGRAPRWLWTAALIVTAAVFLLQINNAGGLQRVLRAEGLLGVTPPLSYGALCGQVVLIVFSRRGSEVLLGLGGLTMLSLALHGGGSIGTQVACGWWLAVILALLNWTLMSHETGAASTAEQTAGADGDTLASNADSSGVRWLSGMLRRFQLLPHPWILCLFLVGVLALTSYLSDGVLSATRWAQSNYDPALLQPVVSADAVGFAASQYVSRGDLNSIATVQQSNPRAIALRVNSDTQPGYLRSRVFDRYSEGGWRIDQRNDGLGIRRLPTIETQNTTALLAPRSASQQTYRLRNMAGELRSRPDMPSRLRSFRVMNDPDRPGRHHFLPLDAVHIQGWGSGVVADEYGMIRGGLNRRSPYFFAAAPRLQPMNLRPERRASLLQRPLVSRAVVASIASQLFRPGESPRAKAAAVSNYFQANYQYSLSGVRRPSNADPLEYFLQQRHPAHCEYFATATAALLRHGGVPCRYAVGFVVDEYNDETERWVARNSDAHSWVEAFDDRTGTWFIVESTPGRSVDDSRFNDRNANTDGPAADAEITVAAGSEIYQQFLAWWYGLTFSDIAGLARVMRTPLIVMTCIVLAIVVLRRWVEGNRLSDDQRRIQSADRKMATLGYQRRESETFHQFARRLQEAQDVSDAVAQRLTQFGEWYRLADTRRCTGQPVPPLPT